MLTAPGEASARVSDVVILDPSDDRCVAEGSIVLGVGLSIRGRDALALLERAGRHAAAVVVRTYEEVDEPLLAAAAAHDVAILAVPPEMPWGQVYSLLRTALVSAGASGEPDAAGVPVGDLFALADAVAAAVGGPVTIEDPQWRVPRVLQPRPRDRRAAAADHPRPPHPGRLGAAPRGGARHGVDQDRPRRRPLRRWRRRGTPRHAHRRSRARGRRAARLDLGRGGGRRARAGGGGDAGAGGRPRRDPPHLPIARART